MRKMELMRKQTVLNDGAGITLVYSITIDELAADGLAGELENYGICVDIPERDEGKCLRGITVSAESIRELAALIAENYVTPCTLSDVVYDWLCSK